MMHPSANPFDRISPTALMVAYARQFTDIPYSQELAELVNAQATVNQILVKESDRPMELTVLIEGRYKAINQVMSQFQPVQVIELASGLSPRGLVMSQNPYLKFVESDLPVMIDCKQQLVSQLVGNRPNLHFAAIDVTSQPSQFPLYANYLSHQKPVIILCEGLLMYLTLTQKQQVFANIRKLLQAYDGVWITPDLTSKDDWSERWRTNHILKRFTQIINQLTLTSTKDTTFDNFNHVEQFVHQEGFKVARYPALTVLEQLTCLQRLKILPETAKSLLEGLSVFILTLKDG